MFDVIAHRGATDNAPENTLPAFEAAIGIGADAIELDVRLTRDRVPVVYHYAYLDEATTGDGPIFAYTYDELQALDVIRADGGLVPEHGVGLGIPLLRDVLNKVGDRIGLEIEIKGRSRRQPRSWPLW